MQIGKLTPIGVVEPTSTLAPFRHDDDSLFRIITGHISFGWITLTGLEGKSIIYWTNKWGKPLGNSKERFD